MNRIVALLLFVVALPVILVIALLIRVDSSGPIVLRQPRIGRKKTEFLCLKFRTMEENTPSVGSHLVSPSSITRVGRFLRASKLDEVPQLVNIFQRDMNFIGFRPCLPNQEEVIAERDSRGIFNYMPGITGLAQIKKIDMSTPKELAEADEQYYKYRCTSLNLSIILATAMGSGWGDRVKPGQ